MRPAPGRELPLTYRAVVALLRPPLSLLTDRHWRGEENLPTTGGFIAVSNHVTNLDPLTLANFLVDTTSR
jgi:1-acyl-sn-glycerol-3-phosphate acyltransferase